jgi:hypothetical protein
VTSLERNDILDSENIDLVLEALREARTENGKVELVCSGSRVFLRQFSLISRSPERDNGYTRDEFLLRREKEIRL